MPQSIYDLFDDEQEVQETTPSRSSGSTGSIYDLMGSQTEKPGIISRVGSAISSTIPQPVKTTVGTALDYLGRPSAALAGAALAQREGRSRLSGAMENLTGERRDSFADVAAKDFGEENLMTKALGFTGDVLADPLNLVGTGLVRNAAARTAGAVAKAGGKALDATGVGRQVVDQLGKAFVPRYGLAISEAEAATLGKVGKQVQPGKEVADAARRFEKERSTIPARMEKEVLKDFSDPRFADPSFRKQFSDELNAGAGSTPDIDKLVIQQHKRQTKLFDRELAAQLHKPEAFDPDYGSFWDFGKSKQKAKIESMTRPSSAISAKLGPARHRKTEDWATAKALGAETDSALAWLHRKIKGEVAITTSKFIQETVKKYGLTSADIKALNPLDIATFKKVEKIPMESPLGKMVHEYYLPEKIADYLDATYRGMGPKTKIGEIYDKAMGWWRSQATILRPGFHGTNVQGNLFNAWLGGLINPGNYIRSAAWQLGKRPAKIGKYTADEVAGYMEKMGIGGVEHNFMQEMAGRTLDETLVAKLDKTPGQSMLKHPLKTGATAARTVGSGLEDFSKRAMFFDALSKGHSLEDASKMVDKFLFDYGDLTTFERNVMRRAFPFYTWMRKNVPLQAEMLAKQPYKYAGIEKVQRAQNRRVEEAGVKTPEGEQPRYLQEAEAVQLVTEPGKPKQYWTPYLPYQDLNKLPFMGLVGGSPTERTARDVAAGLNPLLKIALEGTMNKSMFFNRPLWSEEEGMGPWGDTKKVPASLGGVLPQAIQEMLFNQVRTPDGKVQSELPAGLKYLIENLSPFSETVGKTAAAVTNPEEVTNPKAWIGNLTGVRVTERSRKQDTSDRKEARNAAKRGRKARQAQKSVKKADADSLYERYLKE